MSSVKRGPAPVRDGGEPFATAEAAWFWALAGWEARLAGARPAPGLAAVARPCEPGDVVRCFLDLQRRGRLTGAEAAALVRHGQEHLAPPAHARTHDAWRAGLRVLGAALRGRGVVA